MKRVGSDLGKHFCILREESDVRGLGILGEILVYSVQAGKILDQIPVDKEFDRITSPPRVNILNITISLIQQLSVHKNCGRSSDIYLTAVVDIPINQRPNVWVS
jgi:hypothetical protein